MIERQLCLYRGVSSRGAYRAYSHESNYGMYAPSKYAPDKIRYSMFLPLMRKALLGEVGADAKTSLFSVILRYSTPSPLLFLISHGQKHFEMRQNSFNRILIKTFLPPPPSAKIKSVSDENNPVHAFVFI